MPSLLYCILADSATTKDSKTDIKGANLTGMLADKLPKSYPSLTVTVSIRFSWEEIAHDHLVVFDVIKPDGTSLLPDKPGKPGFQVQGGHAGASIPMRDNYFAYNQRFDGLPFPVSGRYAFTVAIDGNHAGQATLDIYTPEEMAKLRAEASKTGN